MSKDCLNLNIRKSILCKQFFYVCGRYNGKGEPRVSLHFTRDELERNYALKREKKWKAFDSQHQDHQETLTIMNSRDTKPFFFHSRASYCMTFGLVGLCTHYILVWHMCTTHPMNYVNIDLLAPSSCITPLMYGRMEHWSIKSN